MVVFKLNEALALASVGIGHAEFFPLVGDSVALGPDLLKILQDSFTEVRYVALPGIEKQKRENGIDQDPVNAIRTKHFLPRC